MNSPTNISSPARKAPRKRLAVFLGEELGPADVGDNAPSRTDSNANTAFCRHNSNAGTNSNINGGLLVYGKLIDDDQPIALHGGFTGNRLSVSTTLGLSTTMERQNLAASDAQSYYSSMGFGSINEANESAVSTSNPALDQSAANNNPIGAPVGDTASRTNSGGFHARSPSSGGTAHVFGAHRSPSRARRGSPAFLHHDNSILVPHSLGGSGAGYADASSSITPSSTELSPPFVGLGSSSGLGVPPRPSGVVQKMKAVLMEAEDEDF